MKNYSGEKCVEQKRSKKMVEYERKRRAEQKLH